MKKEWIEEAYCSYEESKLLKEKGFDENCRYHYLSKTLSINYNGLSYNNSLYDEVGEGKIAAPTQQMAMRWLREEKSIFIEISVSIDTNGDYHYRYSVLNKECKYERKGYTSFDWKYEDAANEALKYCLENLL